MPNQAWATDITYFPTESSRSSTVTDKRSSGLAALASGHVLNLVRSREEEIWQMDVFSPDLTFIQRLQRDAFGLPVYRNFAPGGVYCVR